MTQQVGTWRLPFGHLARLDLDSDFAAITVLPLAAGEEPRLEISTEALEDTRVEVIARDGAVRVNIRRNPSLLFGFGLWGNGGKVTLYVPAQMQGVLRTQAGTIDVLDMGPGRLDVKSEAGRVTIDRFRGNLRASTEAGKVEVRDLRGSFDLRTSAGAIELTVAELAPGQHSASTDLGEVSIELPANASVDIEAKTGVLGSINNKVPQVADAASKLHVKVEVGEIRIRQRSGPSAPAQPQSAPAPTAPVPPVTAPWAVTETPPVAQPSGSETERILKLVESGQLSAKEAAVLLRAIDSE